MAENENEKAKPDQSEKPAEQQHAAQAAPQQPPTPAADQK